MTTPARPSYLLLAALLVLTQVALLPLRGRGQPGPVAVDVTRVPFAIGAWQGREAGPFDRTTLSLLQPDAYLHRVYERADGSSLVISVTYGRRKGTFHSPGFCLLGGGWSILRKGVVTIPAARPLRVNRFLLQKGDDRALVLYYYLHRHRALTSWTALQARLFWDRLGGGSGTAALVRVVVPAEGQGAAAERVGRDFLVRAQPALLRSMGG
jgi:EpsI family protein